MVEEARFQTHEETITEFIAKEIGEDFIHNYPLSNAEVNLLF